MESSRSSGGFLFEYRKVLLMQPRSAQESAGRLSLLQEGVRKRICVYF